jgi:hypothetical protein
MKPLYLAVLSISAACCADAPAGVLLDLDLTKGAAALPPSAKVTGGVWKGGWEVTDNGQRILLDAGSTVKNGALEVVFTRADITGGAKAYTLPPFLYNVKFVSVYEDATLGKSGVPADGIRIQVANGERYSNRQAVVSARAKEQGTEKNSLWGANVGKWSDYKLDGKSPMAVRLEWKDGTVTFTDVTGAKTACKERCRAQIDALRYIALGGDSSSRSETTAFPSAIGVRFLAARLVDLDKSPAGVPAMDLARFAKVPPQSQVEAPSETTPPTARKRVVFEADLTRGASSLPKGATVIGGAWENGWKVTANQQRIVVDPGYVIRNGMLEVTLSRVKAKLGGEKVDTFGIYEDSGMDHSDVHGDSIMLRIGRAEETQGVQGLLKAFTKERIPNHFGETWREHFGEIDDWYANNGAPHTFKFEWRNGGGAFTDSKGNVVKCPKNCDGNLNAMRYVALGGDRYDGAASLIGATFLRVKLVDFDAPEK